MNQFVLKIQKPRLDELLMKSGELFRLKASDEKLFSLVKFYACYLTFEGSTFFNTNLSVGILSSQAKNYYFKGDICYSINLTVKKINYTISPGVYDNECHYIVRQK